MSCVLIKKIIFVIYKLYLRCMNRISFSFDSLGIVASSLCAIHCIATPFIFIAKACASTCCAEAPIWWILIDYIFLIVSFIAIYYTTRNTTVYWIKYTLWTFWTLLLFTIANHSLNVIYLPEKFIYIPAFTIIILHFYNLQFCKCQDEKCCQE